MRAQLLLAHRDLAVGLQGKGQYRRTMVEGRGAHAKAELVMQQAVGSRALEQGRGARLAGDDAPAQEAFAMQLADLEAGRLVADAVPEDAAHQALQVVCQPRWAEDAAGRIVADA